MSVLHRGECLLRYFKQRLPNYGVFDEQRYFKAGTKPLNFQVCGMNTVLTICEDIWDLDWLDKSLGDHQQIDFFIKIFAYPFHGGTTGLRETALANCARKFRAGQG